MRHRQCCSIGFSDPTAPHTSRIGEPPSNNKRPREQDGNNETATLHLRELIHSPFLPLLPTARAKFRAWRLRKGQACWCFCHSQGYDNVGVSCVMFVPAAESAAPHHQRCCLHVGLERARKSQKKTCDTLFRARRNETAVLRYGSSPPPPPKTAYHPPCQRAHSKGGYVF